jgi:hypothetical protein
MKSQELTQSRGISQSRVQLNASEVTAGAEQFSEVVRGYPVRLDLYSWNYILPEFTSPQDHEVIAELPDGRYETWTGVAGQIADAWPVYGYPEVLISVRFKDAQGEWQECRLRRTQRPRPYPDPRVLLLAEDGDNGLYNDARVWVIPSR